MSDCLFCKIIAGEIPSTKVYEDDACYAFRDINPQAPVHVVLVPKAHVSGLNEVFNLEDCRRSPPGKASPRAATAWCPTAGRTPASPSSTSTSTSWAAGRWRTEWHKRGRR